MEIRFDLPELFIEAHRDRLDEVARHIMRGRDRVVHMAIYPAILTTPYRLDPAEQTSITVSRVSLAAKRLRFKHAPDILVIHPEGLESEGLVEDEATASGGARIPTSATP